MTAAAQEPEPRSAANAAVSRVLSTIPVWWARRAAAAGLPCDWQDWRLALDAPPIDLGERPVEELVDASPTNFGESYVRALDRTTRLRDGCHYTPSFLADVLWREVGEAGATAGLVVDPACGAGSLLLAPVRRAVAEAQNAPETLRSLPRLVHGTDVDAVAVWLGNVFLAAEMLPLWAQVPIPQRGPLPRLLRIADGLARLDDKPATVVMNPPYGRVGLVPDDRRRWELTLYGHANAYGLFLHAAIERVRPGGVVAAIVPTSFLGGAYYRRLREFIADLAPLSRLTFVDTRAGVFSSEVLQETCIAILRRGARGAPVRCSKLSLNAGATTRALPTPPPPSKDGLPWLLPRRAADGPLIQSAARMTKRLSDYGWKASTGPLVWNRHKRQIFSSPGERRVPIVWGADVEDGRVRRSTTREPQRWLKLRPRDEFMQLTEPAIFVQRTTAPEQPRRLIAARFDRRALVAWGGAVVVENHVNVLRCADESGPLTPRLLEALLRTATFDRLYRCLTGTVAVSAYELEALPLPGPELLVEWQALSPDRLQAAVSTTYEDEAP